MPSDAKRLSQAMQHIARIKVGDYPAIVGRDDQYRIVERPWRDLAEPAKLAVLQDAVDWSGISNRDQSHILLAEIDPGRITDAQRGKLIEMAAVQEAYQGMLEGKARAGTGTGRDQEQER